MGVPHRLLVQDAPLFYMNSVETSSECDECVDRSGVKRHARAVQRKFDTVSAEGEAGCSSDMLEQIVNNRYEVGRKFERM